MWSSGLINNKLLLLFGVLISIHKSNEDASIKKQGWQPYCPTECICHYTSVYCDNQNLKRVPRPIPTSTVALYLRDNFIRRVPYRRLRGLHKLKHLLMKANHIVQVEGHALKDLKNLVSLSLTDNRISYLSPKIFLNQANLQVLSLRNNRLRHVKHLFHNTPKLQLLNLANNRIRYLNNDMIKNLPYLRVMDIHGNNIKHLSSNTFSNLPNLRFLVLRDNDLGYVNFEFPKRIHLELLDLTNCNLRKIPQGLPNTINDLRLSENQIKEIEQNDFNTTKEIRLLVLNNNKINKIHPKALASLENLYDLYLGKNKLTKVPYGLPRKIHGIYANYNNITAIIEGNFNYQSELEFLFLRNNDIKKIEQTAFQGLKSLRSLDLSRNKVMSLKPHTFSKLRTLELLDLSKNPIDELENGCFHGLHKLTILQLSSVDTKNYIASSSFRDMRSLRFLDLSNSATLVKKMAQNKMTLNSLKSVEDLNMMNDLLKTLPSDFPNHFPLLKVIKLIGNPWHCDESILWLTDWMRNRTISFYAPHFMVCSTPKSLSGKQILTLQRNEVYKANPPRSKQKLTPTVPNRKTNKVRGSNLGVIFKIIENKNKQPIKKNTKRMPFYTRQGLSNLAIKITPNKAVMKGNNTTYTANANPEHKSFNLIPREENIDEVSHAVDQEVESETNNNFLSNSDEEEKNNEISQFLFEQQKPTKEMEVNQLSASKASAAFITVTESDNNVITTHNLDQLYPNNNVPISKSEIEDQDQDFDANSDNKISNIIENNKNKKTVYLDDDSSDDEDENMRDSDDILLEDAVDEPVTKHRIYSKRSEESDQLYKEHQYRDLLLAQVKQNNNLQSKELRKQEQYPGYYSNLYDNDQIPYDDRIFENIEQAEKFLLQTYSNTMKRNQKEEKIVKNTKDRLENDILKDKSLSKLYSSNGQVLNHKSSMTERQPLFDDSSGRK